jgi:hypothetical protein
VSKNHRNPRRRGKTRTKGNMRWLKHIEGDVGQVRGHVARAVVDHIQNFTAQGKSGSGARLKRYDQETKEQKRKEGKDPNVVNLRDTGRMMSSLGVIRQYKRGSVWHIVIGPRGADNQRKAALLINRGRPWLRLGKAGYERLIKVLEKYGFFGTKPGPPPRTR